MYNQIGAAGAAALSESLKRNATLTRAPCSAPAALFRHEHL
jgi:hypothetical protein